MRRIRGVRGWQSSAPQAPLRARITRPPPPKLPGEVGMPRDRGCDGHRAGVRESPSPRPPPPLTRERGRIRARSGNSALRSAGPLPRPLPAQTTRGEGRTSIVLSQHFAAPAGALTRLVTSPPSPASGRGYKLHRPFDRPRRSPSPAQFAGEGRGGGRRRTQTSACRRVAISRPPPLPRSWGRGRQPSRGTSERPGGGEGLPHPRGRLPRNVCLLDRTCGRGRRFPGGAE
jgi:hypothetical protein